MHNFRRIRKNWSIQIDKRLNFQQLQWNRTASHFWRITRSPLLAPSNYKQPTRHDWDSMRKPKNNVPNYIRLRKFPLMLFPCKTRTVVIMEERAFSFFPIRERKKKKTGEEKKANIFVWKQTMRNFLSRWYLYSVIYFLPTRKKTQSIRFAFLRTGKENFLYFAANEIKYTSI